MSEFSEEILGFIPDVIAQQEAEVAARQAQEAEHARAAEAKRLAEQTADERYRALGREVVHLLQSNHIPTLPVYARTRRRGPVHQVGDAWPVKLMHTPERSEHLRSLETAIYLGGSGASSSTPLYALQDTGTVFRYRRILYEGDGQHGDPKGKKYEGIVFPEAPLSGQQGLDMLQYESFKRGIAALISTRRQ